MAMNSYVVGSQVRVSATFTSVTTGLLVDPTSVVLTVKDGQHNVTSPTPVVRDSLGVYHFDLTCSVAGIWSYHFAGTGAAVGVQESTFNISPSII